MAYRGAKTRVHVNTRRSAGSTRVTVAAAMAAENRKGQFVKREREPGTAQQYNQQAAADAGVGMRSHGFAPTPSQQPGMRPGTKGGPLYARYAPIADRTAGDLVL